MKITVEIDDEELRRVLAPLVPQIPVAQAHAPTKLLTVQELAERLAVSRSKAYELLYKGEIQSLTIGRTRRVSPVALAEFISRPKDNPLTPGPTQSYERPPRAAVPKVAARTQPPRSKRRPKPVLPIDLSPRQANTTSSSWMSDSEFEEVLSSMLKHGWPTDVIDDIRRDHTQGIERTYVLAVNDAARYLGLTRAGVEKLIKSAKLRLFTIAPTYRDQKPSQRIPAKDVASLA